MIDLKLFILIDKQLQKVKRSSFYSITVFRRLHLIVLIEIFINLLQSWKNFFETIQLVKKRYMRKVFKVDSYQF